MCSREGSWGDPWSGPPELVRSRSSLDRRTFSGPARLNNTLISWFWDLLQDVYPADITFDLIKQKFNPYKCEWGGRGAVEGSARLIALTYPHCLQACQHCRRPGIGWLHQIKQQGTNHACAPSRPADGHIHETRVDFKGTVASFKWYTMGRAAFEMAYVLPDRKTV